VAGRARRVGATRARRDRAVEPVPLGAGAPPDRHVARSEAGGPRDRPPDRARRVDGEPRAAPQPAGPRPRLRRRPRQRSRPGTSSTSPSDPAEHRPRTARGGAGQARAGVEPEQIAGWLRATFPLLVAWHVCHETIYQALYHGGKGGLTRTLTRRLRTGRPLRKRGRRPNARQVRFIAPAKLIDARPAEVAERARLGDWEGDLIVGPGSRSAIGTLVDRRSRYLLLVHLPDGHSERGLDGVRATWAIRSRPRRSSTRSGPRSRDRFPEPAVARSSLSNTTLSQIAPVRAETRKHRRAGTRASDQGHARLRGHPAERKRCASF
jgi:hypothetical protein